MLVSLEVPANSWYLVIANGWAYNLSDNLHKSREGFLSRFISLSCK